MDHAMYTNTAGGSEGMLFVFNAAHALHVQGVHIKISGARLQCSEFLRCSFTFFVDWKYILTSFLRFKKQLNCCVNLFDSFCGLNDICKIRVKFHEAAFKISFRNCC